jgi:hypothetical protein
MTLTERRKADRVAMAAQVAALATAHGFAAEVHPEPTFMGERCSGVWVDFPHDLSVHVWFDGESPHRPDWDTYVLSWYTGGEDGWRLAPHAFADVNPYNGCKATDVARGFDNLLYVLGRRFAAIADGSAFTRQESTT